MSASPQFVQYVAELLEPMGPLKAGRFFGGVALKRDGVQFAMVMGNSLYFVVNDHTRPQYEQAGMEAFSYLTQRGRVSVRKYFATPPELLDDPDQLRLWAREAIEAAAKK
ncbi:MAG: TfoX/Sxy family protein [Pseudomonadota bacterium]